MSTFDDQTDFSFLSVVEDSPKSAKTGKSRSVDIGNTRVEIGVSRRGCASTRVNYEHSAETRAKIGAGNRGKAKPTLRKPRSAETRAKISAAKQGQPPRSAEMRAIYSLAKSRPVQTPQGVYASAKAAGVAYGVAGGTIGNWMKRYPNQYYYKDTQ
jgi:hypothetical protein